MKRDAGFTLLEVLVALVVLGLLVAGLGQGLRFGLDATMREERAAVARGDLDAVDRLLRRLVEQADPGTEREPARLTGTESGAAFTTDLGAAASALATTRAEVRLEVSGGRLVLRWRPSIHAIRIGPPPPMAEVVLLDGVERLVLGYWGRVGEAAPDWHAAWDQAALPRLLRMHLVFAPGSPRHWPDLVTAPAHPRPRP